MNEKIKQILNKHFYHLEKETWYNPDAIISDLLKIVSPTESKDGKTDEEIILKLMPDGLLLPREDWKFNLNEVLNLMSEARSDERAKMEEQHKAEVAELKKQIPQWISVKEQLPDKGNTVIGFFPDGDESGNKIAPATTYDGKTLISDFPNSTAHCFKATHWMPLPTATDTERGEGK